MKKLKSKIRSQSRRQLILNSALAYGGLGFKSLLLGLPPAFIARRAMASETSRYLIFSESRFGDPVNANAPGTYVTGVRHPKVSEAGSLASLFETPTSFQLGNKTVVGAEKWGGLSADLRQHLHFTHMQTNAPSHNEAALVMSLYGGIKSSRSGSEILPSAAAEELHAQLGTLQKKPISLTGHLTYQSIPEAEVRPSNLKNLFIQQSQGTKVSNFRDQLIDKIYKDLKTSGTPSQKAFLDNYAISRTQARLFSEKLGDYLSEVKGNTSEDQVRAALALIKLGATPVVRLRIRFGGDNHSDKMLERECKESIEGIDAMQTLWDEMKTYGLADKILFSKINVFGRTLEFRADKGRDHNRYHSVGVTFGTNIKGGLSGGLDSKFSNTRSAAFNSSNGSLVAPDIPVTESHTSLVKTIYDRLGFDAKTIDKRITKPGKIIGNMKA